MNISRFSPIARMVTCRRSGAVTVFSFAGLMLASLSTALGMTLPPEGTNVAPLSAYTLSPRPNADYAPERTGRELTDGLRAFGRFWSNGQSIGWEKRSPVLYRQKFTAETPLRSVEIGTGKNNRSMIALPSHAFVYVAGDDGRFALVGDAREPWQRDEVEKDGTTTLRLQFNPVIAREVAIVLFRDSPFIFMDEVQILSARAGDRVRGSLTAEQLVSDAVERRKLEAERRAGQGPIGSVPAERYAWPLPRSRASEDAAQCTVTRVSPWTEGTAEEILGAPPAPATPSLHVTDGWLVSAFRVENRSNQERSVRVSYGPANGTGAPRTSVASYVLGLDYRWRADVVVRADRILLPPNSFALVLAEAPVTEPGDILLKGTVECGQEIADFDIEGRAVPIDSGARPYGNLWSYLVGPVAHTQSCWPSFHQDVGVDTAVVNERALNKRVNREAETLLRTYVRTFSKSRRLLLYMEMTDHSWPQGTDERILEPELTRWWSWVSEIIKQEKFAGQVALYPIDEVKPNQVSRLNTIAKLFRKIAPGVPIYGTVGHPDLIPAVDLDIIQVIEGALSGIPAGMAQRKELHIYATRPIGKTLSMNNYYRRISWLAFGASMRGSGLWAMWDSSGMASPKSGWSDFGGAERDYGMMYGSAEECVYPSRRLLAWRRGLEDLAVLEACHRRTPAENLRGQVLSFARERDRTALEYDATLSALTEACAE